MLRRLFLLGVLLAFSACASACPKEIVGNESASVILLDFSRTFAPYGEADAAALREMGAVLSAALAAGLLEQPAKVLWAAFGDQGMSPILPCGPPIVFRQQLTKPRTSSADVLASTKVEDFKTATQECVKAVMVQSVAAQQFTDVSGALAFATSATKSAKQRRLIQIYSDLKEDLPADRERVDYDLSGNDIVLIWKPGSDDLKQPAEVQRRIHTAEETFRERGAARVCSMSAQSITSGDILSCLSR